MPNAGPGQPGRRPSHSRRTLLGLGIVFTFLGLLLVAALLPTSFVALGKTLPIAAAGLLLLWLGGVLLGRGGRPESAA